MEKLKMDNTFEIHHLQGQAIAILKAIINLQTELKKVEEKREKLEGNKK